MLMNIANLTNLRNESHIEDGGIVVVSMRGLGLICDVSPSGISQNINNSSSKLSQMLEERGFYRDRLIREGFPDMAVAVVVEYYALDAGRYCTVQAKNFLRASSAIGTRVFLTKIVANTVANKEELGRFVHSGVTALGNIWRVFIYHKKMIPIVYVEGNWFLQIRGLRSAFGLNCSMNVDLTIDLNDFEWMFHGMNDIEKHGNFASLNRVKELMKSKDLLTKFENWANALDVFAEPKEETKSLKKEEPQLVVKEEATLGDVKQMSDSLTVFHSFAMRLINEVHKDNVMNVTNEQLKRGMLEVAFDMLKFVSNV